MSGGPALRNLRDLVTAASGYGDGVAFRQRRRGGPYRAISYAQFGEDVAALGTALLARGLAEAPVALLGENQYGWSLAYYAVACAGKVVVPLSCEYSVEELANLLRQAGATTLVASARLGPLAVAARERLGQGRLRLIGMETEGDSAAEPSLAWLLGEGRDLLAGGDRRFYDALIADRGLMSLMFTSGTTGKAKGVMVSHRSMAFFLNAFRAHFPLAQPVEALSVLPLYHILETAIEAFLLSAGATITYSDGIQYLEENLREVAPTFLVTVPMIVEHLYKAGMAEPGMEADRADHVRRAFGGRIQAVISGGAPLNTLVVEHLSRSGIPIYNLYGCTEALCVTCGARGHVRHGSAGRAVPGVQLRIADPDERGVGEIVVRSDSVMCGYFEDAAATMEAVEDGWLYTGDLGRLDADGYLWVTGRRKNVIVGKSGKNVYPEDLEVLLNRSPFILESMVYGQECPETGDVIVAALIVPNRPAIAAQLGPPEPDEATMSRVITEAVAALNRELPIFRQIARVTLRTKALVKTPSQKLKRHLN